MVQRIYVRVLMVVISAEAVIKKPTINTDSSTGTSDSSGISGETGSITNCDSNSTGIVCNPKARLISALFDNHNTFRPYCGRGDVINVTLDVALRQLMELDEPQQILKIYAWIRMNWNDCQLAWNASDYDGIDSIIVSFETIWIPDITLYDSAAESFYGYREFRPQVFSNGDVIYNFPTVIESQCLVNVRYFPFDTQKCRLTFGSWAYHGFEVDFEPKHADGDLSAVQINSEWDFIRFQAQKHVTFYRCCPEPYPDVTFTLEIKRKPLYYMINIVIPTFLITFISVLVFILPVESGEKIGLAITIMLALSVFQLLISDNLPPSAETIPIIALFFDFMLALCAFACVTAAVAINVYFNEGIPMPQWLKRLLLRPLAKLSCVNVPDDTEKEMDRNRTNARSTSEPELLKISKALEFSENGCISIAGMKGGKHESTETQPEHWKILSLIIDRIGLIIFLLAYLTGTSINSQRSFILNWAFLILLLRIYLTLPLLLPLLFEESTGRQGGARNRDKTAFTTTSP